MTTEMTIENSKEIEIKKKKQLALFDPIKKAANDIAVKLKNFVITDGVSRDKLFAMSKEANSIKNQIDSKRKELLRPLKAEKKGIQDRHAQEMEEEIAPLAVVAASIDVYAKDDLMLIIDGSISNANQSIMAFDEEEKKRKQKKLAEIEAAEKARLKQIADDKAEDEKKEKARLKRIEDEKKLLQKSDASGIQKKLDAKKIADKAIADKKIVDDAAEEKIIDEEKETKRLKAEKEALTKKSKGREKKVYEWSVDDIDLVPDEHIVKSINKESVTDAYNSGVKDIPGISVKVKTELKFN